MMGKRVRLLVLMLLLLVPLTSTFASPLRLSLLIKPSSEKIETFRFQSGVTPDNSWQIIAIASPFVLEAFNPDTEYLFVQQTAADTPWSDTYIYRHDHAANAWLLTGSQGEASATSLEKVQDDASEYIPSPWRLGGVGAMLFNGKDAAHLYTNSFGGGVELSANYPKFIFSASAEAHVAQSNNTIWADRYTILMLTGGVGYPIVNSKKSELDVVGRYGLIVHHNNNNWYFNQRAAVGLRYSYGISERLRPFIEGDVGVMFTKSLVTMMYNGSVGLQYTL